jgi:hypothetical protein
MDNIVTFLRKTADEIENGTASIKLNLEAVDFYAKYVRENSQNDDLSEQEIYKYLSMGWYVYQNLEDKK